MKNDLMLGQLEFWGSTCSFYTSVWESVKHTHLQTHTNILNIALAYYYLLPYSCSQIQTCRLKLKLTHSTDTQTDAPKRANSNAHPQTHTLKLAQSNLHSQTSTLKLAYLNSHTQTRTPKLAQACTPNLM